MDKKAVVTLRLNDWREARILADDLQNWTFRGQQDGSWTLSSTLQRAAASTQASVMLTGAEEESIEQFQRRAHHFLRISPPREKLIDWMALIQHFGGATRLLDCTKSFYVAAFFAVEKATTECAIWCINHYAMYLGMQRFLKLDDRRFSMPHWQTLHRVADFADKLLETQKHSFQRFVFEVQPFELNERLTVQQGMFLCPLSVDVPFIESLAATFDLAPIDFADSQIEEFRSLGSIKELNDNIAVIKLLLPLGIQHDVLQDLWNMNVNAASLFPGLDGLGRSLNYYMRIQNLWDVKYQIGGFDKK